MKVVLTGFFCQFTARATLKTRGFAWLQIEREARSLAEESPQQATSLAAGVRSTYTINIQTNSMKKTLEAAHSRF